MPSSQNRPTQTHPCFQVVSEPSSAAHEHMERIRSEYVVRIQGTIRARKDPNKRMDTGLIELEVEDVTVLNSINVKLPFLPSEDGAQLSEEVRLRNRVLDLR